jgi:hypothetical protein
LRAFQCQSAGAHSVAAGVGAGVVRVQLSSCLYRVQ